MGIKNKILRLIIGDIFLILISYYAVLIFRSRSLIVDLFEIRYLEALLVFIVITIVISSAFRKYSIIGKVRISELAYPIIKSNLLILGFVSFLIYILQLYSYSRLVVFGVIYTLSVFELTGAVFYFFIQRSLKEKEFEEEGVDINARFDESGIMFSSNNSSDIQEIAYSEDEISELEKSFKILNEFNKDIIIEESGSKVYQFIKRYIDISSPRSGIFSTTTKFNIDKQPYNYLRSIVNLHRINDFRRINKFFESVNRKLPNNGLFICCVETKNIRKKRILRRFPPIISHGYYLLDFLYKRVWPKLPGLNKLYFFISNGNNRVLSKQETLGRLYSCGFALVSEAVIDNLQYFISKKVKNPVYDYAPSYGPIFKMRRIGKEGQIIYVFKFRTMYPYSEYLQKYIYDKHKLDEGGKFDRDIRITSLGRIFRKFWLDELPMLVNWARGELKLVGVRPLSEHYLSLYSEELRKLRWKYKPGLLPPYYADMPKKIEDIMASEMKYLQAYSRSPLLTDFRYFFTILFNIVFKRARSK